MRGPIGNDIIFTGGDIGGFACNRGPLQRCTVKINKGPCESGGGVDVVDPCLSVFVISTILEKWEMCRQEGNNY